MNIAPDMRAPLTLLPLRLEDVIFAVGGRRIIDGVSMTLTAATRTMIVGPNGAGKSVLLRLCHGLLRPRPAESLAFARNRRRAATPGDGVPATCPAARSALANVIYALKVARVPPEEREERHAKHCTLSGWGAMGNSRTRAVGRRAAAARQWRALGHCGGSAVSTSRRQASILARRTKSKRSSTPCMSPAKIVMVTHNLGQARRLGDEILLLHQGRLVERAPQPTAFSNTPNRPKPLNFWKENCHGNHPPHPAGRGPLPRRPCVIGTGEIHHRRLDDIDRAIRTVRLSAADLEQQTGVKVRVVALGTGQALDVGRRGDADVVFACPRGGGKVSRGRAGVKRYPVMYNDFVLIGPKSDPAKIAGSKDILVALKKPRDRPAPFVSRGDRSGTTWPNSICGSRRRRHRQEQGPGIRDTGQGMGPALNTSASMGAYVADRGPGWRSRTVRTYDSGRRRQAPVQPVRRDAGESR
jgi:ABC-type nitrate/sulfonate/bicarbonate transport system ATPase subunit